jgi:hypothetical protein
MQLVTVSIVCLLRSMTSWTALPLCGQAQGSGFFPGAPMRRAPHFAVVTALHQGDPDRKATEAA